jgi:ketosteroid isomerase-like protein
MSQENVEIMRSSYEAFASGGLERYLEFFADDVDYRADDTGPIHGKDALRAFFQDWIATFDGFRMEPLELIDAGEDTVVVVERFAGCAKLSGVETDQTAGELFTLRDGKIARGREYLTRDEALEAAAWPTAQENVETLRRGYRAFTRGDKAAVAHLVTSDVEWGATPFPGIESVYRGHDGMRRWMDAIRSAWAKFEVTLDEVLHDGANVVVVAERVRGRGRQSGAEVEMHVFSTYWFEGVKVRKRSAFTERKAALEAVGLRE